MVNFSFLHRFVAIFGLCQPRSRQQVYSFCLSQEFLPFPLFSSNFSAFMFFCNFLIDGQLVSSCLFPISFCAFLSCYQWGCSYHYQLQVHLSFLSNRGRRSLILHFCITFISLSLSHFGIRTAHFDFNRWFHFHFHRHSKISVSSMRIHHSWFIMRTFTWAKTFPW